MSIISSINNKRERGISDKDILKKIIDKNPDKKSAFKEALKRKASHTEILEEIIKQNKKGEIENKKKQEEELKKEKE